MDAEPKSTRLHIAIFPWFAFGHLKINLHLSNKLAQRGHKISFLAPTKTLPELQPLNFYPHLITFVPVKVPHVEGLPYGAETTKDIPLYMGNLLATALDRIQENIKSLLFELRVDVVFFDFAHWVPKLAKQLGIKSIFFDVFGPASIAFMLSQERPLDSDISDPTKPPIKFPYAIKIQPHEARALAAFKAQEYGDNIQFLARLLTASIQSDAIASKASREIEGDFCDYVAAKLRKPILLTGPFLPEPPRSPLEKKWDSWLSRFKNSSVIYCAFGTECILSKDQFQELLLGLELTGLPFLAALKPPVGAKSVEDGFPDNFQERTKGRGIVNGGWVQQQLILQHPSIGCFITHCGSNSLSEALLTKCQLVFLPNIIDQIINSRLMGGRLKVGVEIQKGDEDGLFTKESVSGAIRLVMDEDSEVGLEVRANHAKIRDTLLGKDLESSYIDNFIKKLKELIG